MPRTKTAAQPTTLYSRQAPPQALEQLTSIGVHFVVAPVLVVMSHGRIARTAFVLFRVGETNTLGHPAGTGATNRSRATAAMTVLRKGSRVLTNRWRWLRNSFCSRSSSSTRRRRRRCLRSTSVCGASVGHVVDVVVVVVAASRRGRAPGSGRACNGKVNV